jgi:hypothetical protein
MSAIATVEDLVGETVDGVCFFWEYLELRFNGPILRAMVTADLDTTAEHWTFPDKGSRDAICGLIGASVRDVEVERDRSIQLRFDDGKVFTISFAAAHQAGEEAAHFVPGDNRPIAVW